MNIIISSDVDDVSSQMNDMLDVGSRLYSCSERGVTESGSVGLVETLGGDWVESVPIEVGGGVRLGFFLASSTEQCGSARCAYLGATALS